MLCSEVFKNLFLKGDVLMNTSKNAIVVASLFVFILLALLSFGMNRDVGVYQEEETQEIESTQPQEEEEEVKELETPIEMEDEIEDENVDYIINDLKAELDNNNARITWTSPPKEGVRNLMLVRTASKPEGRDVTYNVSLEDGAFQDDGLMPGMRYYYELRGDLTNGEVRSAIAHVDVPGKVELSVLWPHILVNGQRVPYDEDETVRSYVMRHSIMIPIKPVIEVLGGTASWVSEGKSLSQKDAVIRYRQLEIEVSAGKFEILVNRQKERLGFYPVVQDGFLYVSSELVEEYLGYDVIVDKGTITIKKPVEEKKLNHNKIEEEVNDSDISLGKTFTLTLPVEPNDGRKWFYIIESGEGNVRLKGRDEIVDEFGVKRHNFVFEAKNLGQTVLRFICFKPGIGELLPEEERVYNLRIN